VVAPFMMGPIFRGTGLNFFFFLFFSLEGGRDYFGRIVNLTSRCLWDAMAKRNCRRELDAARGLEVTYLTACYPDQYLHSDFINISINCLKVARNTNGQNSHPNFIGV